MRAIVRYPKIWALLMGLFLNFTSAWAQTEVAVGSEGLAFLDYAVIFVYFAVLVWMGFYFSKREKNTETFFLGGRKIPWWAVGISIFGTSLSAITYVAIPAAAFSGNWVGGFYNMGILVVAPFVAMVYLPRLLTRPYVTAYEYLEIRFNLATRIYGSVAFGLFQLGRMSIVLYLPALAMNAATGIDIYFCIIAMGVLATLYTVLGGIEAVIWTDVIQSVVLLVGALLALTLIMKNIDGGLGTMVEMASAEDKFHMFNWGWDASQKVVWVVFLGGIFSAAYPVMADQTVVQRYLATGSPKDASKALWVNALMTLPMQVLFFGMGTALWVYYKTHAEALPPDLQKDAILPLFVIQQFPTGLKGLLIAGLFAASMSSLDSSMNSLSSVLVNDYYKRFWSNVTEEKALFVARATTLILGLIGTFAALYIARLYMMRVEGESVETIFDLFLKILGVVGGGLSGIFFLGTMTKRTNGIGAITGGLVSSAVLITILRGNFLLNDGRGEAFPEVFKSIVSINSYIHPMVGFGTAVIVAYGVSLMTGKPKETTDA